MRAAFERDHGRGTAIQSSQRIPKGLLIAYVTAVKVPYVILRIEDEQGLKEEVGKKRDEFLDVYSLYLATGFHWIREEAKLKAYELHLLDPTFNFQV